MQGSRQRSEVNMEKLEISAKSKERKYPIFIGQHALDSLAGFVRSKFNGSRVAVVIDKKVLSLQKSRIESPLEGIDTLVVPVAGNESSKSREMKEKIEDNLLDNKFGRDAVIIAVGGGVIGDLSGFVASTFNRGVPFIQIPTTLLSMADASIGGKTSVNTRHGKNLIGAFHQPAAVFADTGFLGSLPDEEFLNGLAEIIKIAAVADKGLFGFLRQNSARILGRDEQVLTPIIKRSIELKKEIVEKDPEENGLRQILNFGHTFGHALEAYYKYGIRHGYAVSQGIIVESKIAALTKSLGAAEEEKIVSLLKQFGFPAAVNLDANIARIIEFMLGDKKNRGRKPRFVILKGIGKIKSENNDYSFEVDKEVIAKAIDYCKK